MADKTASPGSSSQDVDVTKLSQDKIRQLMKSDPKFISRLIMQLDKQMHNMMRQKQQRQEQISADTQELDKIEHIIQSHVNPNLERLQQSIKQKTELRDGLKQQLVQQTDNLKAMKTDAASIIQSARARTTKLLRETASQRLEEARGFSSRTATSTLIRTGGSKGSSGTSGNG